MNTPRASDDTAARPPLSDVLTPSIHWSFKTTVALVAAHSGSSWSAACPSTTMTCSVGTASAVSMARRSNDVPRNFKSCFGCPIRLEPPAARMTAASNGASATGRTHRDGRRALSARWFGLSAELAALGRDHLGQNSHADLFGRLRADVQTDRAVQPIQLL